MYGPPPKSAKQNSLKPALTCAVPDLRTEFRRNGTFGNPRLCYISKAPRRQERAYQKA